MRSVICIIFVFSAIVLCGQVDSIRSKNVTREVYKNIDYKETVAMKEKRLLQGNVSEKSDSLDRPLADVKIKIKGTKLRTRSDSNGNYLLELPRGFDVNKKQICYSLKGYHNEIQPLTQKLLDNGGFLNFEMQPKKRHR